MHFQPVVRGRGAALVGAEALHELLAALEGAKVALYLDGADNFRGGVRMEFRRVHLTLEQGGTNFAQGQSVGTSLANRGNVTINVFDPRGLGGVLLIRAAFEAGRQAHLHLGVNAAGKGGIGIQVEIDPETERLKVIAPMVGTPAYNAGVLPGDLILAVPLFLISPSTYMDMAVKAANGGLIPWYLNCLSLGLRDNLWALVLCLVIILVIIFTADSAPLWIYQGF